VAKFNDALRGYAHDVLRRDNFVCRYCGLDGKIWPNWLHLSWDHLLPVGHALRDDPAYIVAACRFCNEAHNRRTWDVDGRTPDELVTQKRPLVLEKREEYKDFWRRNVLTRNEG
jgi:5-methylcytosine-specific restriction endonuclease McrA